MQFRELSVPGAFEVTPLQHPDSRGVFFEWFRLDLLEQASGHTFSVRQANQSVSGRGVLRGIHYADVPPGQAKLVMATTGAAIDFVIDLRVGSPTFGTWDSVLLDSVDRRAVFLPEGLGHAFVTLEERTTVNYLVSTTYDRDREHAVHPLDPTIALRVPEGLGQLELSARDQAAPTLEAALSAGALPDWSECQAFYESTAVR